MGSVAAAASAATTDIVRKEEKQTALTAAKPEGASELLAVEVGKVTDVRASWDHWASVMCLIDR